MKKSILLYVAAFLALGTNAAPIGQAQALKMADKFFAKNSTTKRAAAKMAFKITQQTNKVNTGDELLYVINNGTNDGYIIMAGDNRVAPILAYSDKGHLEEGMTQVNPNLQGMLEHYQLQMEWVKNNVQDVPHKAYQILEASVQVATPDQVVKPLLKDSANPPLTNVLTDSISQIVSACPGEIGVAVIVNNRDTVKVNNKSVYPMMSVFKVHQALALCNDFDNKGISLDTLVNINRDKLDPKTWSPMLKDYSGPVISLTVRDLLRYTLTQSDNNASNLMFKDMVNVAQTDSFIATLIPRSSFQIAYTEEEMSADHNKAYSNYTSPLGAAMLMNRLFTEGLIDDEKQSFIKNTLKECKTGVDRIAAPLLDKEGVVIAHKTGSGYVNENGVLAAHNDVAYICLPNNISYTLAVFVKDFKGNESQASQYVAHISAVVYSLLMQTSVKS